MKTKESDRYALEVSIDDGAECMLSISIKGDREQNRIRNALFLGCHFFNDKRFGESKKSYNENNCQLRLEKAGQNCLIIYRKNAKVGTNNELTFLCQHKKTITITRR